MGISKELKVVLLGAVETGKTTLAEVGAGRKFNPKYTKTVGHTFNRKIYSFDKPEYEDPTVKLMLWDASGEPRTETIAVGDLQSAHIAILVFEIKPLESNDSWVELMDHYLPLLERQRPGIPIAIVGTKADLRQDDLVELHAQYLVLARQRGVQYYFSTSARTGFQVDDLFKHIALSAVKSQEQEIISHDIKVPLISLQGRRAHPERKKFTVSDGVGAFWHGVKVLVSAVLDFITLTIPKTWHYFSSKKDNQKKAGFKAWLKSGFYHWVAEEEEDVSTSSSTKDEIKHSPSSSSAADVYRAIGADPETVIESPSSHVEHTLVPPPKKPAVGYHFAIAKDDKYTIDEDHEIFDSVIDIKTHVLNSPEDERKTLMSGHVIILSDILSDQKEAYKCNGVSVEQLCTMEDSALKLKMVPGNDFASFASWNTVLENKVPEFLSLSDIRQYIISLSEGENAQDCIAALKTGSLSLVAGPNLLSLDIEHLVDEMQQDGQLTVAAPSRTFTFE